MDNKDARIKRLYYEGKLVPDRACQKCKNKVWLRGSTILTWICPKCGSIAYINRATAAKLVEQNNFKMPVNM